MSTPSRPDSAAFGTDRRPDSAAFGTDSRPPAAPYADGSSHRSGSDWGDSADGVAGGIGRHWGLPVALGLLTLLAGVAVLVWPRATVGVVAIVAGLQLIINGVIRIVQSFAVRDAGGGERFLLALTGILSVLIGALCLRHLLQSVAAVVVLVGIFWLIAGIIDIVTGLSPGSVPARGWRLATGAASVLAGLLILAYPDISLRALTVVLGVWLLLYGGVLIVTGIAVRRLDRP
ncbi:MAG TPA: HdeD family acid-resistance protein [Mycobacteriales bacterium]|nr:HdeD family acid-resistance protein [Mycobacteriales bacterium]